MIAAFLLKIKGYAIIVGAAVAAFLFAYAKGRTDATARNERRILESEVETRKVADGVRRDVDSDNAVGDRLRQWTRPGH